MSDLTKQLQPLPRLIPEQNKRIMFNEQDVAIDFQQAKEYFDVDKSKIEYGVNPHPIEPMYEGYVQVEIYDEELDLHFTAEVSVNHQWLCELFGVKEEMVAVHGPTVDCDQGNIEGYVTTDTYEQLSDELDGNYEYVRDSVLEALKEGNTEGLEVVAFA